MLQRQRDEAAETTASCFRLDLSGDFELDAN